jgi:outer membrane receptor protein involved in Fe transport
LLQFQNRSEVTAKGLEAAVEGRWDNGMRGRIGYSFVETLDKTTGAGLANSPKHMVNFNLIYPLVPERLFAGIDNKYTSKLKTLAGNHTNDAVVTNLTLTFENIMKRLEIQVGIYNLFDVEYGCPGFGEHTQDIIEQDGRTFGAKMTYRF